MRSLRSASVASLLVLGLVACGGGGDDDALFSGGSGSGGAAGASAGSTGKAGSGTAGKAGSGTSGSGTAGSGTAGTGTAGSGTSGSGTAGTGTAGTGTAGTGTAGTGTAGTGAAGTGTAGSAGKGTAGTGTAGTGTAGTGTAGTGTAGTGTAGTGTAGTGTAGTGTAGTGTAGTGTAGSSNPTCDAVGSDYRVDPNAGDDAMATGSGTMNGGAAPSCAFKTVTKAIAAINASGASGPKTITIVGPASLDPGETYPLRVPAETTVTTTDGEVAVAITGKDKIAFVLEKPAAGIDGAAGLTITGTGTTGASHGITVQNGATDQTFIRRVVVDEMSSSGLEVRGSGHVTIGQGVEVKNCGSSMGQGGLFVGGDGGAFATIKVAPGELPTSFHDNQVGIFVNSTAGIHIEGELDPSDPTHGTVETRGNLFEGLVLLQVANPASPVCPVTGLASFGNGTYGVSATTASKLVLRRSSTLGNDKSGVRVFQSSTSPSATVQPNLGTLQDPGLNLVHGHGDDNKDAGICFEPGPVSGGSTTLSARGNDFDDNKNCATFAAVLSKSGACANGVDVGGVSLNVQIDTLLCTQL